MPSIPWKHICLFLLFRIYGPEITSEKFQNYTKLLSHEYCKDHEDKTQCIVEQIKSLVLLANDTYHSLFANLTTYLDKTGIKQTFKKYFTFEKEKDLSDLYKDPSGKADKENVNVSTAMSTMLEKMQEYKNTLQGNSAKDIKERLGTIAYDYEKTNGFCTVKFGIDPSDVVELIDDVAKMTNMTRELQNTLEKDVKVIDAGSSMAKNTEVNVDGKVHYILIAVYRNGNNSLDIGLAVFYTEYKISPHGYQKYADQETLQNIIRFLENDKDDADGRLVDQGKRELKAYFYGEAYNMFMYECPALLTGFKKVQNDIKSDVSN